VAAHVVIRHLSKSYREGAHDRWVFRDACLEVARGECVAILGRSGSGKSTLLNLVSGIDLPDSGEIRVGEHSVTGMGEPARTLFRRREVGFVFQFFNLIPTLTVAENLLLPLELNRVARDDARGRVTHWLAALDLADRAGSFPDVLSGGEQQRVALARALIHRPSLLLADEPTGNLDADTAERVLDTLFESARQTGASLLMATHSRAAAARAARVISIRRGALVAGTSD
jgi:putative ABC transport system ATP-binding protein